MSEHLGSVKAGVLSAECTGCLWPCAPVSSKYFMNEWSLGKRDHHGTSLQLKAILRVFLPLQYWYGILFCALGFLETKVAQFNKLFPEITRSGHACIILHYWQCIESLFVHLLSDTNSIIKKYFWKRKYHSHHTNTSVCRHHMQLVTYEFFHVILLQIFSASHIFHVNISNACRIFHQF